MGEKYFQEFGPRFWAPRLMSLGIKSFATEGIHDRFLDSRWVPGFTIGSWIHDESLRSP